MPPHLPSPRVPDSHDAPPLRWGVLGTGWIAAKFVTALQRSTRQVVQAVGSRSAEGARRAAHAFRVGTAHPSYEALVCDPEVDVVYVATPHHLHLPHALLAIEAGKHVLVEKPVGLDAGEARQVGDASARAGVFCMEAMWSLFLPRFDVVRQLLADGVLGEPRVVLADLGEWFDAGHRIMRADLAGGPMLDLGTYPVTLATWVLGAPDRVVALETPAPNGINGQLTMALRTAAGAAASLLVSTVTDTPSAASITGDLGRIDLPGPSTSRGRWPCGCATAPTCTGTRPASSTPGCTSRPPRWRGASRRVRPALRCDRGPTRWRRSRSWTASGTRPVSASRRRWPPGRRALTTDTHLSCRRS